MSDRLNTLRLTQRREWLNTSDVMAPEFRSRSGPVLALLWMCLWSLSLAPGLAAPAPAPLLISPAAGATDVDPDTTLTWRWVDELLFNGSFETGLSPGWSVGGANPTVWQVYTDSTNAYGMGYRWATTFIPNVQHAAGQLLHNFQIPINATSATLEWKQRVWNLIPSTLIGRLRAYLFENGSAILLIENATGSEPIYTPHEWVSRSTNLLAYAGRTLQLVFQADSYSAVAANSWFADIDGIRFSCEHPARPDFHVYVGGNPVLGSTDSVTQTSETNYSSIVMQPYATYYWRVDAVRDGTANQSLVDRSGPGNVFSRS